MKLYNVHMV